MNNSESRVPALIELDKSSGELRPSESYEGYIEFVPSAEEREAIEGYLKPELDDTLAEYEKTIFAEARENIETYKAQKMVTDDGEAILPSPQARIAADQIIASTYNKFLRPKPLLSIEPYFPQTYDVAVPVEMPAPAMPGMPPQPPQTVAIPVPREAEKVATTWEVGYEFILRERLNFPHKLNQILTDTVTGAAPCWVKVVHDRQTRTVMQPTTSGVVVDLTDKREVEVQVGDPVKWVILPVFNVIRPLDQHDIQASPWLAEAQPTTPDDFLLNYYNGEYPLIEDDDEAERLAQIVRDFSDTTKFQADAAQTKVAVSKPKLLCDLWEVWFYRDVKIPNPDTPKKKFIKRLSLMGMYHRGAGKLLSCYRNPYDHQLRPYEPYFEQQDPHTLSGSSTVGKIKWHQRVKTQLIGLELQSASSANNVSFFADPDVDAYEYLSRNRKIRNNELIPKRQDEYVEKWRKGEGHYSLLPLIQYVDSDGMRAVNMSSYEEGMSVPGRTPAATVSQILQQGGEQPGMLMKSIGDHLVNTIKMDLRTRRQFYPLGETFHIKDPESQKVLEILFQFPVEDAIDNFRFAMTATDEEMAKEHEMPQLMALLKLNQERANFVATVAGPMANPQLLPSQTKLFSDILKSDQAIMDRVISLTRTDGKVFDFTKDIDAIVQEKQAAVQQAQMQQAAMQQKGMNSGGAEGGVPAAGAGGGPGGPNGVQEQPGPPPPPEQAQGGVLPPENMAG